MSIKPALYGKVFFFDFNIGEVKTTGKHLLVSITQNKNALLK
jgi:hypothetical protein